MKYQIDLPTGQKVLLSDIKGFEADAKIRSGNFVSNVLQSGIGSMF